MKRVLIAGASGMVGHHILEELLSHADVAEVVSLVRKPGSLKHDRLKEVLVSDFLKPDSFVPDLGNIDVVFYGIGVYTGAVPAADFRKITVDMPVVLGQALKEQNPDRSITYCLLSGQGADRTEKSRMMFARDKGAAENQLTALFPGTFHTFRPAYIYPVVPRNEPNFSYRLSRWLYKPLIARMGTKWSIKSTELAAGMVKVGLGSDYPEILENADILSVLTD